LNTGEVSASFLRNMHPERDLRNMCMATARAKERSEVKDHMHPVGVVSNEVRLARAPPSDEAWEAWADIAEFNEVKKTTTLTGIAPDLRLTNGHDLVGEF
jgi:hypothetical protein